MKDSLIYHYVLSIENEVGTKIDFGDIIDDFAAIKSRKINLWTGRTDCTLDRKDV